MACLDELMALCPSNESLANTIARTHDLDKLCENEQTFNSKYIMRFQNAFEYGNGNLDTNSIGSSILNTNDQRERAV